VPAQTRPWRKWLAYGAFAVLAFAFALRQTFPAEAVRERIIIEAAAQGWQARVADVQPAGFFGVDLTGITFESRDGLRVPVERLQVSPRLWALLLGRQGASFDARLFDGRVRGVVEASRTARHVAMRIANVDLARVAPVRRATGVDLAGTLGGDLDVTLDLREPAKSAGHVDLAVENAKVNGGEVPVPGMAGTLSIPKVDLGRVVAKASVKDGRAVFDTLQAKGQDLEVTGEGLYLVLQQRLEHAPVFGKAKLRLYDSFWTRGGTAGFRGVAEMALAQAKGRDGAYGFQVYGTLSAPQAKASP
jgi:type II secretion system protein N